LLVHAGAIVEKYAGAAIVVVAYIGEVLLVKVWKKRKVASKVGFKPRTLPASDPQYGGPSLQDGQTSNLILRIEVGALARRYFR